MKTVCVIGGGIAGLAVTKELHERGIPVECFEMMPRIGGVFASKVWSGGRLTSSSVFTWYSDFPVENRQTFFTWEEMLAYLENYVDRFDFRDRIRLNSRVHSVEKKGDRWRLRIEQGSWSNGHPFHPANLEVEETSFQREDDHLVLCTGLHQAPSIPSIPGLDSFTGSMLHSSEYREAEEFRDKRVLIVGSGESASDIAAQLAKVSSQCTISMRSAPGTLFPRWIQGNTPDIRDDRLTYNLPRLLAPLILKGQRRFYRIQKEKAELFHWAAESNFKNNRCPFNTNACKSFGIPESIVTHGATSAGPIQCINGPEVTFSDGTSAPFDSIVFCTGFCPEFPFLEDSLSSELAGLESLWKQILHPDLGDSIFLAGFSRPQQINLVTVAELQARAIGEILDGRSLPEDKKMWESIAADRTWMLRYYGDRYQKNPALVDYLYYTDGIAKFIGCYPPFLKAAIRDPLLWFKLIFTSMSGAHFRLAGPGANWQAATQTIGPTGF